MQLRSHSGFSLVELSIVLVILGLLTGGILAGQSLIRASELRAVITEYNRIYAAGGTFRDKYLGIPGDFSNATRFWLKDSTAATCTTNSSASTAATGACDGDGDGTIEVQANTTNTGVEELQVWRHLTLAGLLEGSYTGLTTVADGNDGTIGTNNPPSKISSAGWSVEPNNSTSVTSVTYNFTMTYPNHVLQFGTKVTGGQTAGEALKPEEAWNIDTKLDDGKPGYGSIIARSSTGFGASKCTTGADTNALTADYALTVTSVSCGLYFLKSF